MDPRVATTLRPRATLATMVRKLPTDRAATRIAGGKHRQRTARRKASLGGRPSLAASLALRDRILEAATELFLTEGYGATSIEAVASSAGVSKRTFYHRFDDKAALFAAVVHRIILGIRPPASVPLLEGVTLQEILQRLAGLILHAALTPRALALHRLVTAESQRFPNLIRAVYEEGWAQEAATLIGDLLARLIPDPKMTVTHRAFAAAQFLHLVVAQPQRRHMGFGAPMTPEELNMWVRDTVTLFLNGCRGLSAAP
jgi:TetR/AcrR family transcriptional regulator, mexJK operon transcriptional repressor